MVQPITRKTVTRADGSEKECLVAYSLGNLVSDDRDQYCDTGIILDLDIEKNLVSGVCTIKDVRYITTFIDRYQENGKYVYEVLPVYKYLNQQDAMTAESFERMTAAWGEINALINQEAARPVE